MRTAKELAEAIVKDCVPAQDIMISKSWLRDTIAQALTAFSEERVKEDRDKRTADDLYKRSYERGLEEAADICDQESTIEGIAQKCAARIRALKEKP